MSTQFGGAVQVVAAPRNASQDGGTTTAITGDGSNGGGPKVLESRPATHASRASTRHKRAVLDEGKQAQQEGINLSVTPVHCFGSHAAPIDGIQSFHIGNHHGRPMTADEKDASERVLYRAGRRICVYDPHTDTQQWFSGRASNVTNIMHFSIDLWNKYICLCESIRLDRNETNVIAQASVFSASKLGRVKTLSTSATGEYICSAFTDNNKYLSLLLDGDNREIHVWHWEKEKIYKQAHVPPRVNKVGAAPQHLMVTTSGPGHMKSWYVAPDSSLKSENMMNQGKEVEHNFLDHTWVPSPPTPGPYSHQAHDYRVVAIAELDPSLAPHTPITPQASLHIDGDEGKAAELGERSVAQRSIGSASQKIKQFLMIFEGTEQPKGAAGAPIDLQLRSTLPIHSEHRVTSITKTPKGLVLTGPNGILLYYERSEDGTSKREPYIEIRQMILPEQNLLAGCSLSGGDKLFLLTASNRVIDLNLAELVQEGVPTIRGATPGGPPVSNSSVAGSVASTTQDDSVETQALTVYDAFKGGFHGTITSGDMPYQRSIIASISQSDRTARIWNLITMKCEFVYDFRLEEPLAISLHPNGTQCLVGFKGMDNYGISCDI